MLYLGLIRQCEMCIMFYKRFVSMEMHAKPHCGTEAFINPVRKELK